jgi:hypothetical protein
MLKLDNNLLQELGLGALPEDQKRSMLQHIYETLELRVGTNLANQMTDAQLEEFEKFIDGGGDANQAQALQWLETNLPNYKQVVNEVFEALKVEIKEMAPQLLVTSQQQPAMPQSAQPQQPYPAAYAPQSDVQMPSQGYSPLQQPPQPAQTAYPPYPPQPMPQPYAVPQAPQPSYPPAAPVQQSSQPDPAMPQAPQPDPWQQQTSPAQQPYQFPAQQPPAGPGPQQPDNQHTGQ